jgi:hemerythrin-like domain-containing protein
MTLVAIVVIAGFVAGVVYAIWREHEEQRASARELERIMAAASENREHVWPTRPGPKGWEGHRR